MDTNLQRIYREYRYCCGYIVGERAKGALSQARKVQIAESAGLEVIWDVESDQSLWDHGNVGDWISESTWYHGVRSGRFEVLFARVENRDGEVLASLGGIIVDHYSDSKAEYLRGFELELLAEASDSLE